MSRPTFAYLPSSHLDLFWLGNYKTCLERGAEIIRQYVERCLEAEDETFLVDTVVFAEYFLWRYPELRSAFLELVRQGRFEVGCAYIDRWETLILGESLIRNTQIGRRWCREVLNIDNPVVTHPDLPSMTPQIAQIYTQTGLRYYVTSRKVYPHGQIWRYRSPDGSSMLVANYPRHYVFPLLHESDDPEVAQRSWVRPLDVPATLQGFPLGTVLVSGSSGDLADRGDFIDRNGRNLEDYVTLYRTKYPQYDFTYATAARVLAPYEEYDNLPCLQGEIPSVWGVAADEEVTFFQRDRRIESQLLTAETLAAVAEHLQISWLPADAGQWQGTFDEAAFFARKDPIPAGNELDELWRMHIFTQDHNGGGQEGALSTFQKRVIQQRCLGYSQAVIDEALDQIGSRLDLEGESLLIFNPHGQTWSGVLPIRVDAQRGQALTALVDEAGNLVPAQMEKADTGEVLVHVALEAVPAVGYTTLRMYGSPDPSGVTAPALQIAQDAALLHITSAELAVAIDRTTGNLVRITDLARGEDWGGADVGRLYALQEMGNDVTLRMADVPPAEQTLTSIEVAEVGPLFAKIRINKRLLKCDVEQTITVWAHGGRLDLQSRIYWWGAHRKQVRMMLPGTPDRAAVTYGAPFYGVGWNEIAEGTAPRNSDEIAPADQLNYREVQGWLHLAGERGGLTIVTEHPAWHYDAGSLAAVLLRTSPSCGDHRLFWENAGEQLFTFTLCLNERDWRTGHIPQQAAAHLRLPATRVIQPGPGDLPLSRSFLQVEGESVALSCLYKDATSGATMVRVWETAGKPQAITISGALSGARADMVNLLGEDVGPPPASAAGEWQVMLPAWGIRTIRLSR